MTELNQIREMRPADFPLVKGSFLSSMRSAPAAKRMANEEFYSTYRPLISDLVLRDEVQALVSCSPERPGQLHGWLMVSAGPPTLWFAYLKDDYRGMGFFRSLLERSLLEAAEPFFYPFHTSHAARLLRDNQDVTAVYNPTLAFEPRLRHPRAWLNSLRYDPATDTLRGSTR